MIPAECHSYVPDVAISSNHSVKTLSQLERKWLVYNKCAGKKDVAACILTYVTYEKVAFKDSELIITGTCCKAKAKD